MFFLTARSIAGSFNYHPFLIVNVVYTTSFLMRGTHSAHISLVHGEDKFISSWVTESKQMNNANREMRAKTAVDPLNACILLLRMECKRFTRQRSLAWAQETELTRRVKVEYDDVFANISSFDFTINVSEGLLDYTCTVQRNVNAKSRVGGTVTIPKEPIRGSYFGT